MKRSKRLIVLAAILAVTCTATFAVTKYETKQEKIKNSDEIILEIAADTVTSLSWEYDGDGLAFHRDDDSGWLYDEDEAFPVSEEKISDILSHFEAFGVSFVIENVEDYGQYGLDDPECTIHLTCDDAEYDIKLGAFSQMDEQRYIDIGDGNAYLVSEDPMDYLESELSAMILHDETPDFENVAGIEFSGKENYRITYAENSSATYNEDDVYFTEKGGTTVPLDTEHVTEYLDTISSLSLSDYVTYNATEEELESYGMDEPELSITVNYTYTDEDENEIADTYVLHISRNPKELADAEEAIAKNTDNTDDSTGEDELSSVTKYVRIGDSQIIYELDSTAYDTLAAASYDDLRHKEVFWGDSDILTQIDITLEGESHTLTSVSEEENDDSDHVWYYGEEEVDIAELENELAGLTADSFTDEAASQKEEISLTLYLENENFPQVTIELYRYDGSYCLAVVDGESVSLVKRSDVMDFVEAVQAIVLN